ncbi:MAG: tRNA pseudouridine(55) synthase TruB [Leptolyngbya sp. PLA1]|nr:tRNA pseudouridine(55) synthase TruB [Leptolyngbya sp. PLA1]
MTDGAPLSGLLVMDKPAGWTSMDVCARVRGLLRRGGAPKRVKVGHTGTLDPMATGVLVVLVGRATRLCERLMADEKVYETTIDLSKRSSTDDAEGEIEEVAVFRAPTDAEVGAVLARFVGIIQQRPPAYSALHVGGRRAYDLAREGRPVDLPARPVRVDEILLLAYEFPVLTIRVTCGKGTYIRSLGRDIGAALGAGGMLAALRRTRVGRFDLSMAHRPESLPGQLTQGDLMPAPEL